MCARCRGCGAATGRGRLVTALADEYCDLCRRQLAPGGAHPGPGCTCPEKNLVTLPVALGIAWIAVAFGLVVAAMAVLWVWAG